LIIRFLPPGQPDGKNHPWKLSYSSITHGIMIRRLAASALLIISLMVSMIRKGETVIAMLKTIL
jgi:hypothetical protein